MKFLERILPGFLKQNLLVYNLSVVVISVISFLILVQLGGVLAIFITFGLDMLSKSRGSGLGEGLMVVILLLVALFTVLSFVLSMAMLIVNLKTSAD